MKYAYDTVYEFDFTGKVQFGNMPAADIYKLFQDGRVASKFLEHTIPTWFEDLEFVDAKGYDHQDTITGVRFDLKGFTKGGASYAPSTMLGAGRSIDITKLHAHARETDYILSDVTEFPRVRVVFKRGTDLIESYPSGKINKNQKEVLFG